RAKSPRCRIRARISLSALRRRRSGGRAPTSTSRWSLCNLRPPSAARTTSWPATMTRSCPW
ncbi:hypothetical protein NJB1907E11_13390, partial [Mycobacterium marinum]